MRRTHNTWIFLAGVLLLPVGWWLYGPLGGRFSDPEYRNDEDFYTLLFLVGGLLVLLGLALIVTAILRGLRKIDRLTIDDIEGRSQEFRRSEVR